jgi:hypothetical protein
MAEWQEARLIPVSGIGSEREAETRATSALLAVIGAVRDLSVEMFSPLGASRAQRAEVRCFTEVPFKLTEGKTASRPDGLISIAYGKSTWTALIEVKTGSADLTAEQVNAYWDIAREQGYDAVVTISNQIAPNRTVHPTEGLKVRANSKVAVHHFSWAELLSMCEVIREHHGVSDPDQAWILWELIRYLRHPNSGATAFDDMGQDWVSVRDGARETTLRRNDPAVADTARRWDQLLRFAALRLEAEIGQPVTQQLPSSQREPSKRTQFLIEQLVTKAMLDGTLRIPNTVGDLEVAVDLRARRLSASISFAAPDDRGGRARCSWLVNQLDEDVDRRLVVEAYAKNARTPTTTTLAALRDDKDLLLGPEKRDPARFRLVLSREMGLGRKTGKSSPGFIDSVLGLVTQFYGTVVQDLVPWSPRAPKITRSIRPTESEERLVATADDRAEIPSGEAPATAPQRPVWDLPPVGGWQALVTQAPRDASAPQSVTGFGPVSEHANVHHELVESAE